MSTDYFTNNKSIKLSEVVELTNIFENLKIEIERGDALKSTDYMEPITTSSGLKGNKRYRISCTSEQTYYEIDFLKKKESDLTKNYLWIYADKDLNCQFTRFGQNKVESIISLIEFHTSIKIYDEHSFLEMEEKFGFLDYDTQDEEEYWDS